MRVNERQWGETADLRTYCKLKGKRGNEQRTYYVYHYYQANIIASTFKCFLIHFAFFHLTDGHHDTTYIYYSFYQLIGPTKFYDT